jgi:chaperone modulatory protein CbpM
MDTAGFLQLARLDAAALESWVDAGWIIPRQEAEARRFSQIDVARTQLIRDLKHDLGVNDEGIGIILDLVDQIHGLRGLLRDLSAVLSAQPEAIRHAVAVEFRTVAEHRIDKSGRDDQQLK